MDVQQPSTAQTKSVDELQPLRELCRAGRLFEVQEWIRQGNPVALKELPPPRKRKNGPLCIAIERGFHSLVQVLLEAGAPIEEGKYHALYDAVQLKRLDLVKLLIEHGAKIQDVSMQVVVATWDRAMVDFFIANGASLMDDNPIAFGLTMRIKMCLGLLKQYAGSQPELMKQADMALRHFVNVRNLKWVSLMLWAGANPWARGIDYVPDWDDSRSQEEIYIGFHYNAVELAISGGHTDILRLKGMLTPPDPKRPESMELLQNGYLVREPYVLQMLIERGHTPSIYKDRCSEFITRLLFDLDSSSGSYLSRYEPSKRDIDTYHAGKLMEMIGILLANGAQWLPSNFKEVELVRQRLIKMAPKYTFNFVQSLQQHQAARRRDVEELVRTPTMTKLLEKRRKWIAERIAALPDHPGKPDPPT